MKHTLEELKEIEAALARIPTADAEVETFMADVDAGKHDAVIAESMELEPTGQVIAKLKAEREKLRKEVPDRTEGQSITETMTALRAALAGSDAGGLKERIEQALSDALGSYCFDCTRVWTAWGVGTMSEDDFQPVQDDADRLSEIAEAVIAALPAPPEAK